MQPIIWIATGPSGSGKTTTFAKLQQLTPSLCSYSWDNLRLEWYDSANYTNAWKLSCEDSEFGMKAQNVFQELIKKNMDIYVDNTNLTPHRRHPFIKTARQAGYLVVGIKFDVELDELIARQDTRCDKSLSDAEVIRQYESYKYPVFSEGFHEIVDQTLTPIEVE